MKTLRIRKVQHRKVLVVLAGSLVLGTSVSAAAPTGSAPAFAPPSSYATGPGPVSVAIGDLNGDGKPDLATANRGAGSVSVLAGMGDGSFQAKLDYATGSVPYSIAIGDLNGDGRPELATANAQANTVSVLPGRGDGSFRAKLDYATGSLPYAIAIGDLNGDGKPDLATANGGADSVSVLTNKATAASRPSSTMQSTTAPTRSRSAT